MSAITSLDSLFLDWTRTVLTDSDIDVIVEYGKSYEPFTTADDETEFIKNIQQPFETGEWGSGLRLQDAERLFPMLLENTADLPSQDVIRLIYAAGLSVESFGRRNSLYEMLPANLLAFTHAINVRNDLEAAIAAASLLSRVRKRGEPMLSMCNIGLNILLINACRQPTTPIDQDELLDAIRSMHLACSVHDEFNEWRAAVETLAATWPLAGIGKSDR